MLRELRGSPVGPLYFVLLKPWISALGDSAFALRAFSVAASLVLIAVTYALGARLVSRRAAALASALVALSPLELYFAQEARMYMLTSLLAAICLWSYAVWRTEALAAQDGETRAGTVSLLRYAFAAVALLFSNPVAGPLLVAINLDALVVWWRTRGSRDAARSSPRRKATLSWIVAQLAVIAIIVAYAASVRLDSAASSQAWRTPLGLERALREAMLLPFNAISGQRFFAPDFWAAVGELSHGQGGLRRFLIPLIVQPLPLLVSVLAGDATIRERWNARYEPQATPIVDSGRRLLLLALLVPLLFCVAISTVRGLEVARYFFYVVPFFMLLLGDGLLRLRRKVRLASFAVLGAAILFGTMSTKASISRDSDYRATAALIEHESQPGDRIMIQPREMGQPLHFYLHPHDAPIIGLAADASAGVALAALPPGRTWVVIDYRSPLYTLAPSELEAALRSPVERDAYTSDASAGVRVALVDTRAAPK